MGVLERAAAHLNRQRLIGRKAADTVLELWNRIDRAAILASWADALPAVVDLVGTWQGVAAASAGPYLDDILEEYRLPADVDALVVAEAFAGVASDGRPLASLLLQPAYAALNRLARGRPEAEAVAAGAVSTDLIVRTQVADAGRVADGVALTARPRLAGYVRMLSGTSCARCVLLAGKFYRWNAGFQRHPRCDCRHIPAPEDRAGDLRTDPAAYFASLAPADQDRVFTAGGAQAIRDGADINRVVNARLGIYTAAGGRQYTSAGTTGRRAARRARLLPEAVYAEAAGDRDEAVRLLRLHGYLT